MTLKTRLDRLERAGPGASNALDELLASVASRGLRIHERPVDLPMAAPADPDDLTAALYALRRAPSLHALSLAVRP